MLCNRLETIKCSIGELEGRAIRNIEAWVEEKNEGKDRKEHKRSMKQ